jgi:hypothetical protein
MASKNTTTNPRRFRVETIDARFVIFDSANWTYTLCPPGASRIHAEQQCAVRNGTNRQKASESPIHQQFRDKFRGKGVTSQDLAEYFGGVLPEERSLAPLDALTPKARRLFDNAKKWLPPMLRAWANEVATQCGYGGPRRRTWHTYLVVKAIRKEANAFAFTQGAIERLHFEVWPTDSRDCPDDIEQRKVLAVHYLSADPDRIKAPYFGVSERTYQRSLDSAHRTLALGYVSACDRPVAGNEFGWFVEEDNFVGKGDPDRERRIDDDDLADDFDACFRTDADDIASFSW